MNTTVAAAPASAGTLGRFELRRRLGHGAQAMVWLAYDPRLEREVAVKVLRADAGEAAMREALHEARAVSRLTHPHIVPVFEADTHDGLTYLVFEHVPGGTLAERLKRDGRIAAHAAVALLRGVLDALAAAHAAGVVHRDLKPSNILLDTAGRARVMDFGIAARLHAASDMPVGRVAGTPGYLSPEAARGEAPSPSMDVFAAGIVLIEMIHGAPLRSRAGDVHQIVRRAASEPLALPPSLAADDALRSLLGRAIAHDPAERFASAEALSDALGRWLAPPAEDEPPVPAGSAAGKGVLEFLLRRMRHKSDFPALSDSVARIQRVASSDNESLNSLANEILRDVALTQKLLRLVNSATFRHAGGGSINTVSRAVALVGFAGIRNLALSLLLLEHMRDKSQAQLLQQEFVRSLMAGSLAAELATTPRDGEEVFIGAMFQNLGRMLSGFYFPEEAAEVRRQLERGPADVPVPQRERQAALRVLGIDYEELGLGVAASWGLPQALQRTMRRPDGAPPTRPADGAAERQRWLAAVANDVADALLEAAPHEAAGRVEAIALRHAKVLGVSPKQVAQAVDDARQRMAPMLQGMALSMKPDSPARRLLGTAPVSPPAPEPDTLTKHELQATLPAPLEPPSAAAAPVERVAEMLAAGIADITQTMVGESFKLNEVLRMVLETMARALDFQRVVFCLRDAKTGALTGRFGLGDAAPQVAAAFRVSLRIEPGQPADLFSAVCLKGADTLITDATVPNIAQRLPAWFRVMPNAPAFVLLPLTMKNAPFGLIYADKAKPGAIALGERELQLLRTLRNQAVMAFRHAGG